MRVALTVLRVYVAFMAWLAITFALVGWAIEKPMFEYMMLVCGWVFGSAAILIGGVLWKEL